MRFLPKQEFEFEPASVYIWLNMYFPLLLTIVKVPPHMYVGLPASEKRFSDHVVLYVKMIKVTFYQKLLLSQWTYSKLAFDTTKSSLFVYIDNIH